MVAKSFQTFKMIGEPFEKNGKKYIIVQNQKTGTERTVRWYTEKEYAKMYPKENIALDGHRTKFKNLKKVLGFSKGYITIFKGAGDEDEWCRLNVRQHHGDWGWYVLSTEEVPSECPFETKKLYWSDISISDEELKPHDKVQEIVQNLLYDDSPSQFVGKIGDRLYDIKVKIIGASTTDTDYGTKANYLLEDENGNVMSWFTNVRKDWDLNSEKIIRGSIKDLTRKNGLNITVLTRCLER